MGLYSLSGTITRLGQSEFNNDGTIYAFIEITDTDGLRTLLKKIAVGVDVEAAIGQGVVGQFYFDEVFVFGRRYLSQFWGVKTATHNVVDGTHFRKILAIANLLQGVLLTPFFGYGLPCLIAGIGQAWSLIDGSADRDAFFRGDLVQSKPEASEPQPLPWFEQLGLQHREAVTRYLRKRFSHQIPKV